MDSLAISGCVLLAAAGIAFCINLWLDKAKPGKLRDTGKGVTLILTAFAFPISLILLAISAMPDSWIVRQ